MRISDWSSDVCSSDLTRWETFTRLAKEGREIADISATFGIPEQGVKRILALGNLLPRVRTLYRDEAINVATVRHLTLASKAQQKARSEEHTSELQSLMRISYAVFCLKKKKHQKIPYN